LTTSATPQSLRIKALGSPIFFFGIRRTQILRKWFTFGKFIGIFRNVGKLNRLCSNSRSSGFK
jgi:hypothetical protein